MLWNTNLMVRVMKRESILPGRNVRVLQVNHALDGGSDEEVLVTAFNTELTRRDLKVGVFSSHNERRVVSFFSSSNALEGRPTR